LDSFFKKLINHSAATSSQASYTFVRIKQELCANMPKGAPQQPQCAGKEQFKIK